MIVSQNKEYAASLKMLAAFYENNPMLELPTCSYFDSLSFNISLREENKDSLMAFCRAFRTFKKSVTAESFKIVKEFGIISLTVSISRAEVCTKKVVGKKMVSKVVPKGYDTIQVEEDVIEWECPKSLMRMEDLEKEVEAIEA